MRFLDPHSDEPGKTRTEFHKLDADLQLAIEELSHTLANLGYQLIVKGANPKMLDIEVWILNKDQGSLNNPD